MHTRRPLLLDLFCKAGGAGMGYWLAGFDVVGVDIEPQKHYPFDFIQADALTFPLDGYDAIHASTPCQLHSQLKSMVTHEYRDVLVEMRNRLVRHGAPWVMENVTGARRLMPGAIMVCGTALGMNVRRHRLFESSHMIFAPGPCRHSLDNINVYGHGQWNYRPIGAERGWVRRYQKQSPVSVQLAYDAFGIHWMNRGELAESIPPAYTKWIGGRLLRAMGYDPEALARNDNRAATHAADLRAV